jgi:HAD superfamily hydrolase (TIGR01490 family)
VISPNTENAVFIDMDYTLYKKFLYQALFAHHKKNKFNRLAMYAFIVFHFPLWLLYKVKFLSLNYFYGLHASNLAWLLRGVSVERADEIWDWVIDNEIVPHLRPEMVDVIEFHRNKGQRIFLISGSFTPLLDKLASRMMIEGAIATPLAVKNERYTGKIIPPINVGEGKLERLMAFLENGGNDIELAKSYFYTDSVVDAPVLEMFGNPVAVYPDEDLLEMSLERGWQVINEERA